MFNLNESKMCLKVESCSSGDDVNDGSMNDFGKMPNGSLNRSFPAKFSGTSIDEMVSFMYQSQYRYTKGIF